MNDTPTTGPTPVDVESRTPDAVPSTTQHAPAPEASPFDSPRGGRGRRALSLVGYAVLFAAAGTAAFLLTRGKPEAAATTEHNHAAPAANAAASPVMLDAEGARRIGVTYATATIGPLLAEVRTVGQLTYDETRVKAIAPKIDGWVDQLYVDFTGRDVREGEPLLSIYSPMLVTAQEELLLAARLAGDVANGSSDAKRTADDLLASAKRRLQYWDIPASEIERLQRTGEVTKTVILRAPVHGVVVEKSVLGGQRIMAGETVYRVADLSTVWAEGEVFERDLAFVRMGQRVSLEFEAYRGEQWNGTVTYIYPLVDATTRTTRVRVEVRNPGLRLKPGMYATMRLTGAQRERTLSVPRSAVLATGQRTIAFVRQPDGQLVPRDIVIGVANDDRVEVLSGLRAGDTVVSSATFLIDSESNLGSALGGMANMPGMDVGAGAKRAPASPRDSGTMPGASGMDMPGMDMSAPSGGAKSKGKE